MKIKTKYLEKVLRRHLSSCAYWVFSGDRHCSCGRDKALEEIEVMKKRIEELENLHSNWTRGV